MIHLPTATRSSWIRSTTGCSPSIASGGSRRSIGRPSRLPASSASRRSAGRAARFSGPASAKRPVPCGRRLPRAGRSSTRRSTSSTPGQPHSHQHLHRRLQGRTGQDHRRGGDVSRSEPGRGPAQGIGGQVQLRRHRRPQRGHAAGLSDSAADRRKRQHGADRGGQRHGQGAVRPGDPQPVPATRQAIRGLELRRAAGHAPGIGVVRLQGGRVHRRPAGQARPICPGGRRHAVAGRDRRHLAGHAGPTAAGLAGADV